MITKIGIHAGNVWHEIDKKGEIKISDLKKATKLDVKDLYLALGWLARENKIHFFEIEDEPAVSLIY
jgi:hypothetical protein